MEISKEEKEAIETLKNIVIQEYDWWINKGDYAESNVKEANDAIKTILNLIKKHQKEIEGLKELLQKKNNYTHELEKDLFEGCSNYVVRKDKIRKKMKEVKELSTAGYEILKELLGE